MSDDLPVDLAPLAHAAVPAPVLERLRGARHVLAVSHEHPDADTLGAVLGVCLLVESLGGRATAACTDPAPPIYDFLPGIDRFRTDPEPGADYDLLVLADCATAERVGGIAVRQRGAVRDAAPPHHRPPRVQRRDRRRRLDRPAGGRDLRAGGAAGRGAGSAARPSPTAPSRSP